MDKEIVSRLKNISVRLWLVFLIHGPTITISSDELRLLTGISNRNKLFEAIAELEHEGIIECNRASGRHTSYSLTSNGIITTHNIDKTNIDSSEINDSPFTNLCNLSMCEWAAKASEPDEAEQVYIPTNWQQQSFLDQYLKMVRVPESGTGGSTTNRYGYDQPVPETGTGIEEPVPLLGTGEEDEDDEESLLSRCVNADDMEDEPAHGNKRSPRRKEQMKLINEAWAQFFDYTTPLGESTALQWLRKLNSCEEIYYAFERASKKHPESPVSYVSRVIDSAAKDKQETKAYQPKAPTSTGNSTSRILDEPRMSDEEIDRLTEIVTREEAEEVKNDGWRDWLRRNSA